MSKVIKYKKVIHWIIRFKVRIVIRRSCCRYSRSITHNSNRLVIICKLQKVNLNMKWIKLEMRRRQLRYRNRWWWVQEVYNLFRIKLPIEKWIIQVNFNLTTKDNTQLRNYKVKSWNLHNLISTDKESYHLDLLQKRHKNQKVLICNNTLVVLRKKTTRWKCVFNN
jgi:hypothetical protein